MNKNKLKMFGLSIVLNLCLLTGFAHASLIDDRQITITTAADVTNRRQALINFIWGGVGFPSNKLPTSVTLDVKSPVRDVDNLLERVDKLLIYMRSRNMYGKDLTGRAYHFIPLNPNNRLVIFHLGHSCTFDDNGNPNVVDQGNQRTIKALLTEGYSVLAVYMPLETLEVKACELTGFHDRLFTSPIYTPLFNGSPMQYFLEPVAVSLNYLKSQSAADRFPSYQDYNMVGLSGGGWTATVYAAIDDTIKVSIPVAGTIPLYNRYINDLGRAYGDTEQILDPFYRIAGYPDLYVLGSYGSGRKQIWILNRLDNCCFGQAQFYIKGEQELTLWEVTMRDYESRVRATLLNLGSASTFRLVIDDTAQYHMISSNAIFNHILVELNNGGGAYVGATPGSHAFLRGTNEQPWYFGRGRSEDTRYPMLGVADLAGQ